MSITTTTHNITAAYRINDTCQWLPLDVNGESFDEIVADMLDFWNLFEEAVEPFTVEDPENIGDATVIELSGRVLAYVDGLPSDTETDDICVLIYAEPHE